MRGRRGKIENNSRANDDVEAEKTAEAKRQAAKKRFKNKQRRKLVREEEGATQMSDEGTAMKSGLSTSPKSFFIVKPCYQDLVQHGGYN